MQSLNQESPRKRMPAVNIVDSPANPSPILSRLKRFHGIHERENSSRPALGGCISEKSLPRDCHDSSDYQAILKVFGDLLKSSNRDTIDAILLSENKIVSASVSSYDSNSLPIDISRNRLIDGQDITDDEIEECGYLGWLSN